MEGTRRAEQLIAGLRWLTFLVGAMLVADARNPAVLVVLAVTCISYNSAILYFTQTRERFAAHGRWVPWAARLIDIALITAAISQVRGNSTSCYLLYTFVLVSTGYSSTHLRTIAITTVLALLANAAAGYYAALSGGVLSAALVQIGYHEAVLLAAAVAGAYMAKGRTYDDMTTGQGNRLQALFQCAGLLTETQDVHDMADRVLRTAVSQIGAAGGQLLLLDEHTNELVSEASVEEIRLPKTEDGQTHSALNGTADWVFSTGRELLIQPGQKSAAAGAGADAGAVSIAAAPIVWKSSQTKGREVLGVILLWSVPGVNLKSSDMDLLLALSALASVGIVNLRLYTNLQTAFRNTLQSLAKGLEARDDYTQGHSERVTKVACTLAEHMNVPVEGIDMLRSAGPLHDIGKVGVPDAILRKNGKLTAEEWESMRRHPIVSEEICRPLGLSEEVLFLVLHHHERLDGKGYPAGLPAQDQPLLLRILSLADCFDALRSRRPYREPMTREELIAEFNRGAGRIFDPTVVEALKTLIESGELDHIYAAMDAEIGLAGDPVYSLAAAA